MKRAVLLFSASVSALLLVGVSLAQTVDTNPKVRAEVLDRLTTLIQKTAFVPGVKFDQWTTFLASERPKIDTAANDEEFKFAVNGALRKFGFSHMLISTPKEASARTTGKTVGVGITSQGVENGRIITRVVPDSPASVAGLQIGDIITEVDGKKIDGITGIPGEEGTKVKLKILRANGKTFVFEITRRPFSTVRTDELSWPTPEVAMIKINTFDRGYDQKLIDTLMVKARTATDLIVDLRFNGGGAVLNLMHLGSYFLENPQSLGFMLDRSTLDAFKKAKGMEPPQLQDLIPYSRLSLVPFGRKPSERFYGNVIILINGGSASASEIFAAGMREQYSFDVTVNGALHQVKNRVMVVGTKSAGAVLFSQILPGPYGFNIQFPVADYVSPQGIRIEGNPIVPDISEADPQLMLPTLPDPPVQTALLALKVMNKDR